MFKYVNLSPLSTMLKKIKLALFRIFVGYCRIRTRMKGVEVASSATINKLPSVRMVKGSRIVLGENTILTSNPRHNPLLQHPVSLRTLTPDAVIEFGEHSGMTGSTIVCANHVTIGEHSIIGAETLIYDSFGHTYSEETGWNSARALTGSPISIGKKCFIGTRCIIMGGVTIGDNCLVSAGTIVTSDIPAGHKAFGNPMQVVPLPKALGGVGGESGTASPTGAAGNMDAFLQQMRELLEFEFELKAEDKFREYGEWDSIAFLTLATSAKEDYGVSLNTDAFNSLETWQDVYDCLNAK